MDIVYRNLALLSVALFVALAVPAGAQTADTTVVIVDLPPGPASSPPGQSHTINFQVQLSATNFACEQAATLEVGVVATAQSPDVTARVNPANASFAVPPGVYGIVPDEAVAPGYNETASVSLVIELAADATPGPTTVGVAATLPDTMPEECAPFTFPQAQDSKSHSVTVESDSGGVFPGPGNGNQTGNQTGNETQPPPSTPGFEPVLVLGAIAAAFAIARRRKGA